MTPFEILSKFFPELVDDMDYSMPQRTEKKYKEIYSDEVIDDFFKEMPNDNQLFEKMYARYFGQRLNDLITHNEIFHDIGASVSIQMIGSQSDSTCRFCYKGNEVILLDNNIVLLYWRLNKAFVYGPNIIRQDLAELYVDILIHFFVHKFKLGYYPAPKTPPHTDRRTMLDLSIITEIQESFVIAHELAHVVLNKEEAFKKHSEFVKRYFRIQGVKANLVSIKQGCEEIEADSIAIESLLSVYRSNDEENSSDSVNKNVYITVTSAAFLLVRYNLWISLVGSKDNESKDIFSVWFIRSAHFRKLISKNYTWGASIYIIEILNFLEGAFEPALLYVKDIIERNIKND